MQYLKSLDDAAFFVVPECGEDQFLVMALLNQFIKSNYPDCDPDIKPLQSAGFAATVNGERVAVGLAIYLHGDKIALGCSALGTPEEFEATYKAWVASMGKGKQPVELHA